MVKYGKIKYLYIYISCIAGTLDLPGRNYKKIEKCFAPPWLSDYSVKILEFIQEL